MLFKISIFIFYIFFIISIPAIIPSFTALATCKVPPIQSPHAYKPSTVVCIFSFTTIFSFFTNAPIFLAKSVLPATPCATNTPSVFSFVPSSNSTASTLSFPSIATAFLFSISTFSALNSGIFLPFVKIVTWLTILIKSFVSAIA